MNMKKIISIFGAIIIVVALLVTAKFSETSCFLAGGNGVNLKELNRKDTLEVHLGLNLQFNQTIRQNLEQGLVNGALTYQAGRFFAKAGLLGGVSTEYGVCCPFMWLGAGVDFAKFQLECQVGNFARNPLTVTMVDPQYGNFCTNMGQSASAVNAMQVSLTADGARIGFGHQGGSSFYAFDGNWFACLEKRICNGFSVTGGVDFGQTITGFAAAKLARDNNLFTLVANKLGAEMHNFIFSYTRNNIPVSKKKMFVTASAWYAANEQGGHLLGGFQHGHGTFYAELGSSFVRNCMQPYCGFGTSFKF